VTYGAEAESDGGLWDGDGRSLGPFQQQSAYVFYWNTHALSHLLADSFGESICAEAG
jgi:hypothetical protein